MKLATQTESIKIGFVPRFKVVSVSALSPLQALAASITLDKQDIRPFREHMESSRNSKTSAGLELAEIWKAEEDISDAFRTLIRAGYTIQPPKQPESQGDGSETAQEQEQPNREPERQCGDGGAAQEPEAAVGHTKRVAGPPEPAGAATGVELTDPSEGQERKRRVAGTLAPHWGRGPGLVASVGRTHAPAPTSFDRAASQLYGPSPPLTPKASPGLSWLEPEVRVLSPLHISDTGKDENPPAPGLDDTPSRCCTYAFLGRESGPRLVRQESSRRFLRDAARSPEDRGSRIPRVDSSCSGCSDCPARRQDKAKTDMPTVDIGLVARLLTIIQEFVPPAHSNSGDVHPGGSRLLIRLLTTIRKRIPAGPSGLHSKSASLRLLSRLFGILRPYMPEDGTRPRITNGAMSRLLGDLLAEIRDFYPDVDPDLVEKSVGYGPDRELSNDYGEPVEPPRYRRGRSRDRHTSGGWARPFSPRGNGRWSLKRGNSWRDKRLPYPTDSPTLSGSRRGFDGRTTIGQDPERTPQDCTKRAGRWDAAAELQPAYQGAKRYGLEVLPPPVAAARPDDSLRNALPPHQVIHDSRQLALYLGACSYVVVLGGPGQPPPSMCGPPSYDVVFVPTGEEWRVTGPGGGNEKARPVVGAAELGAYLGASLSMVIVGDPDLDPDRVRPPGRRYGAVVVPIGEEWRLRAWDGRPDHHPAARDGWVQASRLLQTAVGNGANFAISAGASEAGVESEYWILGHGAPQKWEDTRLRPRCDGSGQCSVSGRCMALIVRGYPVSRPWSPR